MLKKVYEHVISCFISIKPSPCLDKQLN